MKMGASTNMDWNENRQKVSGFFVVRECSWCPAVGTRHREYTCWLAKVPGWLQVIHLYGGGIRTLWAFAAGHRLAKDDSQPLWLPGFLWALVGAQPHPLTDSLSVPLSQAAAGLSTVTDSGPQSLKYQWWGSFHKMFADPAATKPHKRTSNVLSSLFWSQK